MAPSITEDMKKGLKVFEDVLDHTPKKRFSRFWRFVFREMEDNELLRPGPKLASCVASQMAALAKQIAGFKGRKKLTRKERKELTRRLATGAILRFDLRKHRDIVGDPGDPATPAGFYRYTSPYPLEEGEFTVFAPCCFSMMERIRYGWEMLFTTAKLTYGTIKSDEQWSLIEAAREIEAHLHAAHTEHTLAKAFSVLHRANTRYKSQSPFHVLWSSQNFYEEGIRFYEQSTTSDFYVSSTTSGLIVPEEFYGTEIYFPGISCVIPPSSFTAASFDGPTAEIFAWRKHVATLAYEFWRKKRKDIKNPFRSVYFVCGIAQAVELGRRVHYQISTDSRTSARSTPNALQEHLSHWRRCGQETAYVQDMHTIYGYFRRLSRRGLQLYQNERFSMPSKWYTLLHPNGTSLLSVRGTVRDITHGARLNVNSVVGLGEDCAKYLCALILALAGAGLDVVLGVSSGDFGSNIARRLGELGVGAAFGHIFGKSMGGKLAAKVAVSLKLLEEEVQRDFARQKALPKPRSNADLVECIERELEGLVRTK